MSGLKEAVAKALPVYEIPDDDLVSGILVPAMSSARDVRIGAGYFSSRCLAQIAPGLAAFIANSTEPLRLLISPEIDDADKSAIERGVRTPEQVLADKATLLIKDARLSESAVVKHTADCLSYLVAARRLELRFVLMNRGMYHKKVWLFHTDETWVAVHGSGNATTRGLLVNGEQMTVDRPWVDGPNVAMRVEKLVQRWERQWNNEQTHSVTLTALQGLRFAGRRASEDDVPTADDFWEAWRKDYEAGLEPPLPPNVSLTPLHILTIPRWLEWKTGRYAHQSRAVEAFLTAGGRGVLEIATGGGKTLTALIAATQCQDQHQGPLLVMVLVPSTPLMHQWSDDVRDFGVEPIVLSELERSARKSMLEEVRAAFAVGRRRAEVLIVTNKLFADDPAVREFINAQGVDVLTMVIGDEMHNLGAPSFINDPPKRFDRRLGLSATPIRQYDPDGTDQLFAFFGKPVYEFSLQNAIEAKCLTPYRYFLHEVTLTEKEQDKYLELTEELRVAGFGVDDKGTTRNSDPRIERLLRLRRAVLEQADGKIAMLRKLLEKHGPRKVKQTLIYASAKESAVESQKQILKINALLSDLGIVSHQFTSAETSRAETRALLDQFGDGEYQVLTAMKVLDEGVDIPQTDTAYILASSAVRREWVQRRGRILRTAQGKTRATLHDFLVLPLDLSSKAAKFILRAELARADEFAKLSENEYTDGGPRLLISKYETVMRAFEEN
jgi:superfamily II DNA or RNA helicase